MPNSKAVFVVDDDPGTLRGVERLLKQHGYDSVLFESAEAFQNHDDIDQALCVILDIDLNNELGIEVRRPPHSRGKFPFRSFILPPTTIMPFARPPWNPGCIAYLTKPFSAKSLIGPLEQASAGLA